MWFNRESIKVAFGFFILSIFWIFFSDQILLFFFKDASKLTLFQTFKGFFYVFMATLFIYYLTNREIKKKNRLIRILNEINNWNSNIMSNIPDLEVALFDSNANIILFYGNKFVKNMQSKNLTELNKIFSQNKENPINTSQKFKEEVFNGYSINFEYHENEVDLQIKGCPVYEKGEIIAGLLLLFDVSEQTKIMSQLSSEKESYSMLFNEYHTVNLELKKSHEQLKLSNLQLIESQERYQTFFMQTSEGIYRIDFETPIDLNLSREEQISLILNTGFLAEYNPVFASNFEPDIQNMLAGKKLTELKWLSETIFSSDLFTMLVEHNYIVKNLETREITRKDEKYFNNSLNGIIENNTLHRIWGIKIDITRQKQYEKELLQAKKIAEDSDKLKSAFLANMSHEIRTPLNGIVGFSELLNQDNLSAEQRTKFLTIIKNSNTQLLRIIDDILDISRIETGQLTINEEKFALNKLMDMIESYLIQELNKLNKQIDISMYIQLKRGNDMIVTDKHRLYQVISNLINNAVKFTEKGKIEFGYKIIDHTTLDFYVSDTGIGIKAEDMESVFKQFKQVEEYTSRKYGGTGLGLSICKGIVALLGGEITVESEIGKGSKFRFSIKYNAAE